MVLKKLLVISAHRLLSSNFSSTIKNISSTLEITTIITNFIAGFDLNIISTINPDLILLPVGLPGLDGLEIIKSIRSVNSVIPIVICCSCYAEAEYKNIVKYNIQGIITTNDSPEELLTVIYEVINEEPNVFKKQYKHVGQSMQKLLSLTEEKLSERDIIVLQLVANGLNDSEISKELNLSRSSIKNILQHIFNKLGNHDRTVAVLIGISKGLITQSPYPNDR